MGAAADSMSGQLQGQLALQSEIREVDREALQRVEESLSASGKENNDLTNQQTTNQLITARSRTALDYADQQAAAAAAESTQRQAIANLWAHRKERAETQASVTSAVNAIP
jgi:hypothetical protein